MKAARVGALVEAARAVADRFERGDRALADALVDATGLSTQGVALALREHLETSPSVEEVEELVRAAGDAPTVHVILSANVFTAGLRALALAAAAAPRVFVRCSSRESVFVPALIEALADESKLGIRLVDSVTPSAGDELHLYGSDETIRTICEGLCAGVRVRAHGTGIGVALVSGDAGIGEAAAALARDIVPFDQRGCLSPRVAILPDPEKARAFAGKLRDELEAWQSRVPLGRVDEALRAELTTFRQMAGALGEFLPCGAGGIAITDVLRAPWFAPTGRNLVVASFDDESAARWIGPMARHVAALGIEGSGWGSGRESLRRCAAERVGAHAETAIRRAGGPEKTSN